jgi:membrane protein involved in colicin uptake
VANPILAALRQVSERVGRSLSEDGAKAVENLYKDTGERTEQVVERVGKAEEANSKRFHGVLSGFDKNAADAAANPGDLKKAAAAAKSKADLAKLLDPDGPEAKAAADEAKTAKKAMDDEASAQKALEKKAAADKQKAVDDMYKNAEPKIVGGGDDARLLNADKAEMDPKKFTDYALNPDHPVGGNKAKVFSAATGLEQKDAADVMKQVNDGLGKFPPSAGKVDQYGQRFTMHTPVTGPKGTATVESGWIYDRNQETGEISNIPRLVTIFVAPEKKK